MGNVLCKEPNTNSTQSTGNTFSNLSSVICPNGLGKAKTHPMRKTYFTRSAVDASKKTTSATGWQSVALHVPNAGTTKVIDTPPVAPPRKKRGATLDGRYRSDDSLQVKNGFHDVFGRESRRHSCDIVPGARPASVPPPRPEVVAALPARQTSCFEIDASNDAFSDFSKVPTTAELERHPSTSQIPRVGNRKSDKFFGERLADSLSSTDKEPAAEAASEGRKELKGKRYPTPPQDDVDRIEKFVEQATQEKAPMEVVVVEERRKQTSENRMPPALPSGEPPTPGDSSVPKGAPNGEGGEDLIKYIDRTVSGDNQIGRRAEFLMAMLEDYNDSVRYDGLKPVEEPLIVPKRKKSRHICDDHDHLHAKLHEHEREAASGEGPTVPDPPNSNVIRTEASIEVAPRKPSRDFSKYKPIDQEEEEPPFESDDDQGAKMMRPVRMKQKASSATQRENLPTPPAPPKFQKSHSESQFDRQLTTDAASTPGTSDSPPKAHTPRMLKRIISMPATEHLGKDAVAAAAGSASPSTPNRPETPQRPSLTKSSSSGSFTSVDLQRARIGVERFTPEDYARHGGVDELVKPKSKLTTRKISWKSNEPPNCRTPTPTQERPENASFTIGGTAVVTTGQTPATLAPPPVPRRKRSDTSAEMEPIGEREQTLLAARQTNESPAKMYQQLHNDPEDSSLRKFCLGSFIESSNVLQHHDVVNVLDRVYTASDNQENIIEQFQLFLEDQLNAELNEPNPANPNVAKLLEKLSRADSAAPFPASEDDKLENVKIELVGSSLSGSLASLGKTSDVDDCFDPEFEKIEKSEIVGELPKIEHHTPKHAGLSSRRRDSVEYMDDWFGPGDSDGSTTMLASPAEEKRHDGRAPPVEGKKIELHYPEGARTGRRESIEEVERWFSNHSTLRPTFGEEFEEPSRRLRRGSDGFLGYDLQRQYPFGKGRERSDSLSAEMFEDITKLHEQHKDTDEGDRPDGTPQGRVLMPPHPKRKVLEHRNSSDALLMKVLHKPHLTAAHGHTAHKPADAPAAKPIEPTTTTTSGEENKPLLNPAKQQQQQQQQPSSTSSAKDTGKLTASDTGEKLADGSALSTDGKDGQHQHERHNEHSTLLKFLSKENLIE